jgi:hypothetical protein
MARLDSPALRYVSGQDTQTPYLSLQPPSPRSNDGPGDAYIRSYDFVSRAVFYDVRRHIVDVEPAIVSSIQVAMNAIIVDRTLHYHRR